MKRLYGIGRNFFKKVFDKTEIERKLVHKFIDPELRRHSDVFEVIYLSGVYTISQTLQKSV